MEAIFFRFLAGELTLALVGSRVEKVYLPAPNYLTLSLHPARPLVLAGEPLKHPFLHVRYGTGRFFCFLSGLKTMSALILIAHVKKGVELAKEHRLGQAICDLIHQHHGTTLIAYFHHKAKEQAEAKGEDPVREEDYRYPGPKPQTKEAGLILLADAIEASSRTLVDPTPSRIKGHIQNIVRKIYTEGELDESQLTLKDLTLLSDTFHRILTGIFHQRIEYPSADSKGTKNGKQREEPVCAVDPKAAAEHAAWARSHPRVSPRPIGDSADGRIVRRSRYRDRKAPWIVRQWSRLAWQTGRGTGGWPTAPPVLRRN